MTKLTVRVTPNARRNEIHGWDSAMAPGTGRVLKVKLNVPPVEGRANRELVAFLAEVLGLPKSAVSLAHGEKSRSKVVAIDGLTEDEVRARLAAEES
jgi:uncharacterized protein (TIGR00251 family)